MNTAFHARLDELKGKRVLADLDRTLIAVYWDSAGMVGQGGGDVLHHPKGIDPPFHGWPHITTRVGERHEKG